LHFIINIIHASTFLPLLFHTSHRVLSESHWQKHWGLFDQVAQKTLETSSSPCHGFNEALLHSSDLAMIHDHAFAKTAVFTSLTRAG
jgi:hypothetical protein